MAFVIGQPYYVITPSDYYVLSQLLGGEEYVRDDFPDTYTDPETGDMYYVGLASLIDPNEEAAYANAGFPVISFGIAHFTSSVQANISFP